MKKYIAPNIECVEMEPLQICAGSLNIEGTPDNTTGNLNPDNTVTPGMGADSKEHGGRSDAWD